MTAVLVELESHRRFAVAERAVIGRGADCDIQLDDPMVSSAHAEVVRTAAGGFEVRDLQSRRGTFVGARKVATAELCDGDELMVGPFRLRFDTRSHITGDSLGPGAPGELARLRAVVELGRAIGVEHDLEKLCRRVLGTCFQLLPADRGAVVVYAASSKAPLLTITASRRGDADVFAVSTNLLSQLMLTHEPYLRTEVDTDVVLQRAESLSAHGVRSVMAVPLRYDADETEWLGVITLDSRAITHMFEPDDLEFLAAIAGQAALAIKNAMLVRRVQTAQEHEWRRFARVVQDLPVGVVVLDARGTCVLANRWISARESLLGVVEPGAVLDAVAGVPCDQLVTGDVRLQVCIPQSERTLSITASTSAAERETVVVVHDVTEARERESKEAHRDRVALVGQLAGGIAHDFNNLLTIIMANAHLLSETLEDPEARADAAQIGQAAESAAELTRQLLTFSRREPVQAKVIDVARAVQSMDKMLARTLGTQIAFTTFVDAHVPRVLMDAAQLEQVVMNLVINARDAMPGGGRVRVSASLYENRSGGPRGLVPGRYALVEVGDNGSGILPDVLARIFEPYFTTKARGKGTGLGLATVSGIVEQSGGVIAVESVVGSGTTFRVYLPATDQPLEEPHPAGRVPARGGTVLVVDDDPDLRLFTERMLRRSGYEVLSAGSGAEALMVARAHPGAIDLLLTDMVMPGLSGQDLASALLVERPATRVLFVSGYHQQAQERGHPFLAKPFDRAALLDKIHDALAITRAVA